MRPPIDVDQLVSERNQTGIFINDMDDLGPEQPSVDPREDPERGSPAGDTS